MAAAVEPQRALLRSYLAKMFGEAGAGGLANHEIALAQQLDPGDPTAWLYAGLLLFRENQDNAGIRDLEKSIALNGNRELFRSRLLLDQDQAVRNANIATVYRDAGLTDYSLQTAARAVDSDYANASAHQFLSESYDALRDPRRSICATKRRGLMNCSWPIFSPRPAPGPCPKMFPSRSIPAFCSRTASAACLGPSI